MRRMMIGVAAAALALSACGSSGGDAAGDATTATTAAAASATTAAASDTTAASSGTTAAAADTTAASAATTAASGGGTAAAANVTVTLDEFTIETGAVAAGDVTFEVKNAGEFPHELIIVKADSFAGLAKDSSGGLDETAAGSAIVAQTSRIDGGASATLTATLEAGKYVFVCNLGQGANNHAAKGQHLDVTVG